MAAPRGGVQTVADTAAVTWVVTFRLAGQEFAVPVGDVIEVVRMVAVTPLPDGVPWVVGVLNYRGRVVPVVDARVRLGLPRRAPGLDTPILIVAAGDRAAGLVVDSALEVLALPDGALAPPGEYRATEAVSGVARQGRRLILLVDVERLVAGDGESPWSGGGPGAAAG